MTAKRKGQEHPEAHKIWGIYAAQFSDWKQFTENFLPPIYLNSSVPDEVRNSFSIVQKILKYSYFEYEFIDLALIKMTHTFEMALRIRYNSLNDATGEKMTEKTLKPLIEWFYMRSYFDLDSKSYLDSIRNLRNHLSHPSSQSLIGVTGLSWFSTIADSINEVYTEPKITAARISERRKVLNHLNFISGNGGIYNNGSKKFIIYSFVPIFCELLDHKSIIIGYCKSIFPLGTELSKAGLRKNSTHLVSLSEYRMEQKPKSLCSDIASISEISKAENIKRFNEWKQKFMQSTEGQVFDFVLQLQGEKIAQTERRRFLAT